MIDIIKKINKKYVYKKILFYNKIITKMKYYQIKDN